MVETVEEERSQTNESCNKKKIEDNKNHKTKIRRVLKKTWESKVMDR